MAERQPYKLLEFAYFWYLYYEFQVFILSVC